jgi:hypothetical protein
VVVATTVADDTRGVPVEVVTLERRGGVSKPLETVISVFLRKRVREGV